MEPHNGQDTLGQIESPRDRFADVAPCHTVAASPSCHGIALRQVSEDDMPFLFRLFADPDRCHLWMQSRQVFDEREFQEAWIAWTRDMMGAKFIVEHGERPIGLVFEYARTLEDGHSKMTTLLEEKSAGHGAGVIATVLLADWLFRALPIRKIYHEVYGYNAAVLRMHRKLGAEETVLRAHRFWDGSWWDLHTFAYDREAFPQVRKRTLRLWRRGQQTVAARTGTSGAEMIAGGVYS